MSKEGKVPYVHYARSPKGLWIKAVRTDDYIKFYHHSRHERVGDKFHKIGVNGEVISEREATLGIYDDAWIFDGDIEIRSELLEFCDLQYYDLLLSSISRHVAQLIALGYGDSPNDVMALWSGDIGLNILVPGRYDFVDPGVEPFSGLGGCKAIISNMENSEVVECHVVVFGGKSYVYKITDKKDAGAFIMSTVPI